MTQRVSSHSSRGRKPEAASATSAARERLSRWIAERGLKATRQRDLIVDFTASGREPTRAKGGYWIHYGLVTPYLDVPSTFNDLPICANGEKSTIAHPCMP